MRLEWWSGPGRYLLLGGALFVLLVHHSWTDAWRGDFWIYVATVAELAARPFHPHNPLLGNDYPFAFFSPYTWVLGLAGRWTGLRAFDVLVVQGLLNLLLLLAALYAFVATWLRRPAAAFYALLFVLFLWGRNPWAFSCFFHLRSLVFVVPYPSTLAFILALFGLAAFRRFGGSGGPVWVAAGLPLMALLWIIHPVNALFLSCGLIAVSLEGRRSWRHWAALGVVFAGGIALALTWPLFPVADLWFRQTALVHAGNDAMYDDPLPRVTPALLGAPWLLLRLARHKRDPLALLGLALTGLVLYGGISGHWSYGRLISHVVLILQVALADACAALEDRLALPYVPTGGTAALRPGAVLRHLVAPAIAGVLIVGAWSVAVVPTLQEIGRGDPRWLGFLESHVGGNDVVLTDLDTCWYVPSFRGRVVAYPMQLPFTPDQAERVRAVERFFEPAVPQEERVEILHRYHVAYLLLPKNHFEDRKAVLDELRPLGQTVYASPEHELLRVTAATTGSK